MRERRERSDLFTLKINTGGAAFRSDEFQDENGNDCLDPYSCELRRLLDKVEKQLIRGRTDGKLIDINGNCVGDWSLD